jgi:predicted PurR-regulated permease PerM
MRSLDRSTFEIPASRVISSANFRLLLFSLLAFGIWFGTLGIILAAPLTVVTYVLVKRLYVIQTLNTPTPIPGQKAD